MCRRRGDCGQRRRIDPCISAKEEITSLSVRGRACRQFLRILREEFQHHRDKKGRTNGLVREGKGPGIRRSLLEGKRGIFVHGGGNSLQTCQRRVAPRGKKKKGEHTMGLERSTRRKGGGRKFPLTEEKKYRAGYEQGGKTNASRGPGGEVVQREKRGGVDDIKNGKGKGEQGGPSTSATVKGNFRLKEKGPTVRN